MTKSTVVPTCDGSASVYVYELPPEFNLRLLKDCRHLNIYTDMCPHVANSGLGQPLSKMGSTSWFATNQFTAEMLFHARVENHPCRTWDPARADLFYVPFYGGLHASSKFGEANLTARDALAVKLVKEDFLGLHEEEGRWTYFWSQQSPEFATCQKHDGAHRGEEPLGGGLRQHGIPYPSYFHPSKSDEMLTWQDRMRRSHRSHLFSFIGNPRKKEVTTKAGVIRDEIIRQCGESTRCKLVKCVKGKSNCYSPREVVKVMTSSHFCLQPPGDSFTRRSTFDSFLAGCIPVFFSRHTAYSQYAWFLPSDPSAYSVYIEGNGTGRVEEVLLKIPRETVQRMHGKVIDMIPTITYAHPNKSHSQFRDAVDVALVALSKHVESRLQLQKQY
ncbi:hypothetical protein L1049_011086 [Liquidambar formosana]|uniref:Exostosin GT47 domain-containing protein n=1 Tax=Liquidambar formosana TaxID=63359 RepID=A0AAP0WXV8_LIQFO